MIVDPRIESYIASLDAQSDPVLAAMEALGGAPPFPHCRQADGDALWAFSRAPSRLTGCSSSAPGYGYSALWFARALPPDGKGHLHRFFPGQSRPRPGLLPDNGPGSARWSSSSGTPSPLPGNRSRASTSYLSISTRKGIRVLDVAVPLLGVGRAFDHRQCPAGAVGSPIPRPPTRQPRPCALFNKLIFSRADLESLILPIHDGVAVCRKR